jgi:hypothetical protein
MPICILDQLVDQQPPFRIKLHTKDARPMPQHKAQELAGGSEVFRGRVHVPFVAK